MAVFNGTNGNDVFEPHPSGGGATSYLVITATSTSAQGQWPLVNVRVNGNVVLSNVVMDANAAAGATQQITVALPAGASISNVGIEYLNDEQGSDYTTGDRNLFIQSVTLNGSALPASSASYLRSADGSVVAGQFDMVWGGTLTFSGAAVQTAAAGAVGDSSATINGGAGRDTAVYFGATSTYTIDMTSGGFTVSGHGIADSLSSVERLTFDDHKVALDINGAGGMTYRLYQAAFHRVPDTGGLGFWINTADNGLAMTTMAQYFIDSPEFTSIYGANLSNQQYVAQLYLNALNRPLDQAGADYWVGHLDAGHLTRAQTLVYFSESPENQAQVIGSIQHGMIYT